MESQPYIWTNEELTAWLDERLPIDRMAPLEQQLRDDQNLRIRVSQLIQHRDQGGHSVGEIWYRSRLSCPVRSELGGYILGTLPRDLAEYIQFHLMTIGCRLCQANLEDLEAHAASDDQSVVRRKRIFESSASLLGTGDAEEF